MHQDNLSKLLNRAIHDDGPEGTTAFRMFREAARKVSGEFYYITDGTSNPLLFAVEYRDRVIEEHLDTIANLERKVRRLEVNFEAMGVAPKKMKANSFPWEKYPDVEMKAFQMLYREGKTNAQVKTYIESVAPEAEDNTTFINQRFVQARPSASFGIGVKHGRGPIDWAELWKIGTSQHASNWIQRVMRHGGGWGTFSQNGNVPKQWRDIDPNNHISAKNRQILRDMWHQNKFPSAKDELEDLILNSGLTGITIEELKSSGASMRRLEIRKQSIIFIDNGRWYHHTVAHLFPGNPDAQMAVAKFHPEKRTTVVEKVIRPRGRIPA